jgi:hypothetical protein
MGRKDRESPNGREQKEERLCRAAQWAKMEPLIPLGVGEANMKKGAGPFPNTHSL